MTKNFTRPTKFPAEYTTAKGGQATIVAEMPGAYTGYIGYVTLQDGQDYGTIWDKDGVSEGDIYDLMDAPRRLTLTREFIGIGRRGHHIIECDPSGDNPVIRWMPA